MYCSLSVLYFWEVEAQWCNKCVKISIFLGASPCELWSATESRVVITTYILLVTGDMLRLWGCLVPLLRVANWVTTHYNYVLTSLFWLRLLMSCPVTLFLSSCSSYHGKQALILLKSANSTDEMAEEIWQVLAKAKYLDWEKHSTERLWRMQSLKYVRY